MQRWLFRWLVLVLLITIFLLQIGSYKSMDSPMSFDLKPKLSHSKNKMHEIMSIMSNYLDVCMNLTFMLFHCCLFPEMKKKVVILQLFLYKHHKWSQSDGNRKIVTMKKYLNIKKPKQNQLSLTQKGEEFKISFAFITGRNHGGIQGEAKLTSN